jgi:hypothetical protein
MPNKTVHPQATHRDQREEVRRRDPDAISTVNNANAAIPGQGSRIHTASTTAQAFNKTCGRNAVHKLGFAPVYLRCTRNLKYPLMQVTPSSTSLNQKPKIRKVAHPSGVEPETF